MSLRSAVFAIVAALCAGCHGASETGVPEDRPPDAMAYSGYDDAGHLVSSGWIELDVAPADSTPRTITGRWELRAIADPASIGPQDGSGALSGTLTGDDALVELHPGQVDDNVQLNGTLSGGGAAPMRSAGTWSWITIVGVRAQGTFRASQ